VYLYPIDTSESPNFESGYYRYIWEDNDWVDLGTTQIDLSDYITREEAIPFIVNTTEALIGCVDLTLWHNQLYAVTIKEFYDAGFVAGKTYIGIIGGGEYYLMSVLSLSSTHVSIKFEKMGSYNYVGDYNECSFTGYVTYNANTTFSNLLNSSTKYSGLKIIDANQADYIDELFGYASVLLGNQSQQIVFRLGTGLYTGNLNSVTGVVGYSVEMESLCDSHRWSATLENVHIALMNFMIDANRADYEVAKNKVTSLSGSSTDTQYPSAKCVWDITKNIREVAEGKCNTFVLSNNVIRIENGYIVYYEPSDASYVDVRPDMFYLYENGKWVDHHADFYNGDYDSLNIVNSSFRSNDDSIFFDTNGYIIVGTLSSEVYLINIRYWHGGGISSFPVKKGDIFLVIETDVPDRWCGGEDTYYKLETSKIDLTNYPTLNGNNTFTGTNTFSDNVYVDTILGKTQPSYGLNFGNGWVAVIGNLLPNTNNLRDFGSSSNKWKDGYIAGTLYGGTYNFTIDSAYKIIYSRKRNDDTLTELNYEFVNICSKNANTTFTFTTPRVDTLPEYKAIIKNIGSSAITLTFTGVTNILCNDDNIVVTNATNSTLVLPANVTIEVSIMNNKMIAINFEAQ
ncbi:MAG: hypothetical protein J6S85_20880, partial [Methanobrevibacter sp.]|nr:hypothetical protein [Methanobrevibacter sp.]